MSVKNYCEIENSHAITGKYNYQICTKFGHDGNSISAEYFKMIIFKFIFVPNVPNIMRTIPLNAYKKHIFVPTLILNL